MKILMTTKDISLHKSLRYRVYTHLRVVHKAKLQWHSS